MRIEIVCPLTDWIRIGFAFVVFVCVQWRADIRWCMSLSEICIIFVRVCSTQLVGLLSPLFFTHTTRRKPRAHSRSRSPPPLRPSHAHYCITTCLHTHVNITTVCLWQSTVYIPLLFAYSSYHFPLKVYRIWRVLRPWAQQLWPPVWHPVLLIPSRGLRWCLGPRDWCWLLLPARVSHQWLLPIRAGWLWGTHRCSLFFNFQAAILLSMTFFASFAENGIVWAWSYMHCLLLQSSGFEMSQKVSKWARV